MILVCTKCKASYLVPATVFANGPRQVRCARCTNTWQADLPPKITAMPLAIMEPKKPVPPESKPASSPSPTQGQAPTLKSVETPAVKPTPIPQGSNLPAIWRDPKWHKLRVGAGTTLGIVIVGALAWFLVTGQMLGDVKKSFNHFFETAGITPSESLVLRNIRSERRFEDGGMHLIVEGEIHNESTESRPLTDIIVNALGPDKKVIQSWRISPPVETLSPGATAPFRSSIVTPEGTVVEVNLSFAEPHHDQP
jgi:predicted Zn finger-like uncharacterized protein